MTTLLDLYLATMPVLSQAHFSKEHRYLGSRMDAIILNISEINFSQLIQYEILEKLVTYIVNLVMLRGQIFCKSFLPLTEKGTKSTLIHNLWRRIKESFKHENECQHLCPYIL